MKWLIFGGPGIGDTIFELALAKAIKQADADSSVDLIISKSLGSDKAIASLLECQSYIGRLFTYAAKDLPGDAKLLLTLRKERYDYGFSCPISFKATMLPAIISKLIGCKILAKDVPGKSVFIDFPVKVPENIHFVQQNQIVLNRLIPNAKLDILTLDSERVRNLVAIHTERPMIALCPGTNITLFGKGRKRVAVNIKEWPVERWLELAERLSERFEVVMLGGRKELELIRNAPRDNAHIHYEYVGNASVKESVSILSQCDLVAGSDTGMMHCAAALGKATVTLFGGTNPAIWRPYSEKGQVIQGHADCAPCHGGSYGATCKDRLCMKSIAVNSVEAVVNSMLP